MASTSLAYPHKAYTINELLEFRHSLPFISVPVSKFTADAWNEGLLEKVPTPAELRGISSASFPNLQEHMKSKKLQVDLEKQRRLELEVEQLNIAPPRPLPPPRVATRQPSNPENGAGFVRSERSSRRMPAEQVLRTPESVAAAIEAMRYASMPMHRSYSKPPRPSHYEEFRIYRASAAPPPILTNTMGHPQLPGGYGPSPLDAGYAGRPTSMQGFVPGGTLKTVPVISTTIDQNGWNGAVQKPDNYANLSGSQSGSVRQKKTMAPVDVEDQAGKDVKENLPAQSSPDIKGKGKAAIQTSAVIGREEPLMPPAKSLMGTSSSHADQQAYIQWMIQQSSLSSHSSLKAKEGFTLTSEDGEKQWNASFIKEN